MCLLGRGWKAGVGWGEGVGRTEHLGQGFPCKVICKVPTGKAGTWLSFESESSLSAQN